MSPKLHFSNIVCTYLNSIKCIFQIMQHTFLSSCKLYFSDSKSIFLRFCLLYLSDQGACCLNAEGTEDEVKQAQSAKS